MLARIPLFLILAFLVLPFPALGGEANPRIVEVKLIEPGRVDSFSRSFHAFWNEKEAPAKVTAEAREWKDPDGNPIQVQPSLAVAQVAGQAGAWKVDMTLRDVGSPGVYAGKIVLTPAGRIGKAGPRTYDVSFVATFKPSMTVLPAGALALKVSNCAGVWVRCPLTRLFAAETKTTDYSIQIRNTSPAPLAVTVRHVMLGATSATPAVLLKNSASQEPGTEQIDLPVISPNGTATFMAIVSNASELSSGSYSGSLQISALPAAVKGNSQFLVGEKAGDGSYLVKNIATAEVGTTVSVRTGVLWPLFVVLLGVVAGRIAATLATSGFEAKLDLFPRFVELDRTIKRLPVPFKGVIGELLDEAWAAVLKGITQGADQTFTNLERHAAYVSQLVELHGKLATMPPGQPRDRAKDLIEETLKQLSGRAPDLDRIRTARDEALRLVQALQASDGSPGAQADMESLSAARQQWSDMEPPAPGRLGMRLAAGLGMLAGTGTRGVSLYYTTLRPAMHLIVLGVLVIYGVWQNYATGTEAATFGSQGISQYAVLFLWGVSSDIINKTLQTISFRK